MTEIVEYADECCGIYSRSVLIPFAGVRMKQHTHSYDHASMICNGAVRLIADGKLVGDFEAGQLVKVSAGVEHTFVALKPNTRIACLHIAESAEENMKIPLNRLPIVQEK